MYKLNDKEFPTKFVLASKEEGCIKCKNIKSFFLHALEGKFDDQITIFNKETNETEYDFIIETTQSQSLPVLVNLETGEHITGFNPPEIMEIMHS